MKLYKLAVFFTIAVTIANVFYPLNASGFSEKKEHVVLESEHNGTHENGGSGERHDDEKLHEEHSDQNNSNEHKPIPQTGPDEGDNRYPSGKDRSVESGNSQTQGKSNSDPDGKETQKNPGDCDKDGSTGDKNGKPCDPGKNNASEQGRKHGEPDCDKRKDNGVNNDNHGDNHENHEKQAEKKEKNENSSNGNSKTISYTVTINNQISINNQQSSNITNHQSTQSPTQVLGAATLAATGDYLFRFGLMLIVMGAGSFVFGLFFLFRKAFNKVFSRGYQSYLYLYEA